MVTQNITYTKKIIAILSHYSYSAPRPGFEPGTPSLTARCSTAELSGNKNPPDLSGGFIFYKHETLPDQ